MGEIRSGVSIYQRSMNVTPRHIRSALLGFLELLESPDRQSLELLEMWLGQLAFLQHFIGEVSMDENAPSFPLVRNHSYWTKTAGEHFPSLTGQPLDNLAEIAVEICVCLQHWESVSEEQALWYYQSSYQTKWGIRLRSLQSYLHNRHLA